MSREGATQSNALPELAEYAVRVQELRSTLGLLSYETVADLVRKTPPEGLAVLVLHLWERALNRQQQSDRLLEVSVRVLERAEIEYDRLQTAYEQACSERDAEFQKAEWMREECGRLRAQNKNYESLLRDLIEQLKKVNDEILPALPPNQANI